MLSTKPKLLLADDEPANLRAIIKVLGESEVKYEVIAVPNGKLMVEMAQKKQPDLIISDWDMPELSGVEAVRILKQNPNTFHIPVIMCTGVMVSPKNLKEALDAGASDYVRKPVEATELLARVNSMLALSQSYQQIIQQKEALLELDKAKSRFFANISHEFRTPLTVILGVIEQLSEEGVSATGQKLLGTGHRQGKVLYNLINQLLDLTKLEAGRLKLSKSLVGITVFLKQTVMALEALAQQKSIELSFQSELEEQKGWLDQQQIERVIFNLISNAIKFTPKHGEIRLNILKLDRSTLAFEVEDTGIGISEEQLPHIFDRFYQVEQVDHEYHGTGIGLALVKELVELHRGSITVSSMPNKGSTFTVELSIQADENATDTKEEKPIESSLLETSLLQPKAGTTHTEAEGNLERDLPLVLVVEDNADLNDLIMAHLAGQYQVISAFDGEEGLKIALEKVPDLIISDVMMPKMDGFELCKRLKNSPETSHIPVIMLTARATLEDRVSGLELGADDYLSKPFDKKELLVRTKNLIELRKLLQQHFAGQADEVLTEPEVFKGSPADQKFMKALHKVLEQQFTHEDFSADTLADSLKMSRRPLDRKLKALIDTSSTKLIQDFRLNKAQKLLQETDLQAGEVAFQVGFSSRAYFYQVL